MFSWPSYVLFTTMLRLAMPPALWRYRRLMDLRACTAAGTLAVNTEACMTQGACASDGLTPFHLPGTRWWV